MDNCANRIEFPQSVSAGVNLSAKCVLRDYSAPQWSVQAIMRGPSTINLAATGNGNEFDFAAVAADTAKWAPGDYWVAIRATDGVNVQEVGRFQLTVTPDLAAAADGYDGRTQAEIALASIQAVIAKRATRDQERYKINERELWRTPIPELLKLKAHYTAVVRRERAAASGRAWFGRQVATVFHQ